MPSFESTLDISKVNMLFMVKRNFSRNVEQGKQELVNKIAQVPDSAASPQCTTLHSLYNYSVLIHPETFAKSLKHYGELMCFIDYLIFDDLFACWLNKATINLFKSNIHIYHIHYVINLFVLH